MRGGAMKMKSTNPQKAHPEPLLIAYVKFHPPTFIRIRDIPSSKLKRKETLVSPPSPAPYWLIFEYVMQFSFSINWLKNEQFLSFFAKFELEWILTQDHSYSKISNLPPIQAYYPNLTNFNHYWAEQIIFSSCKKNRTNRINISNIAKNNLNFFLWPENAFRRSSLHHSRPIFWNS